MPMSGKIVKARRIENEHRIAILAAKLLKETTGKGPRNVKVKILEDIVEIFIEGFLTELEKFLLGDDRNILLVEQIRDCIRLRMNEKIEAALLEFPEMELQILHVQRNLSQDYYRITLIIT